MGGGTAAVAAGSHPSAVSTAFLMDPVDWNLGSSRVDGQYLTRCVSCYICVDSAFLMLMQSMATHLHYASLVRWLCNSCDHEMYGHSLVVYRSLCLSACVSVACLDKPVHLQAVTCQRWLVRTDSKDVSCWSSVVECALL